MGSVCSSLFPRRDKEMSDGNGGGSVHDTDLEGSIHESAHVSRSDDEISADVPDPTHMITQPEDESKNQGSVSPMDSVGVLRNEDGVKDLVLGATHITEPGSNQQENLRPTGLLGVDIARNGDQAPVPDPTPITQPEDESRRRKKRGRNWEAHETQRLIECKLQDLKWDEISELIPGRRSDRCRQRWDTIIKPYKKVKRHCDAHGKDVSQVTEQEVGSMKLGMGFARNPHWLKMIDEYYSSKSGVPRDDLNGAIAAPTVMVGENDLPIAPYVVAPKLVTTASPVQATAVGAAVRFPHCCLQWKVVLQIVSFLSSLCFVVVGISSRAFHLQFTRRSCRAR